MRVLQILDSNGKHVRFKVDMKLPMTTHAFVTAVLDRCSTLEEANRAISAIQEERMIDDNGRLNFTEMAATLRFEVELED